MGHHPAHRAPDDVGCARAADRAQDTIAAVATPPGRGGVGVVRASGPAVRRMAGAVLGRVPEPRMAHYGPFRDATGEPLDRGIALFFPGPRSLTGEDVLELHGHGGPVVLDLVLGRLLALGARPARPGEFLQRAFLNDKVDLAQAEAIADLIDSATAAAARSAQRSMQGCFSEKVAALVEALVALRTYVEAAIDFPEEEVDHLSEAHVDERLKELLAAVTDTHTAARQGVLLKEGATVVIAGRPNVGKSSLLNRFAGRDAAIVTEIPGTTRDVVREHIQVDGLPLHVLDTAGLRAGADAVERQGVERAWAAIRAADAILLVVDDRSGLGAEEADTLRALPETTPLIVARNKIDLTGTAPATDHDGRSTVVWVSAKTGAGVARLAQALKAAVGYRDPAESSFLARRRHLQALEAARGALQAAKRQLESPARAGELLAEDLRQAQRALGEITGEFTSEDLLDRIFSSFCIGK
ncbi:MAG: tRNA uridine-5-carboxymethylaminomethyl(34) synthesis GTPase MnmE [Gammaproteobacteria bacterium]|nr:tRNA uridine-5-carboxymethylaminomethyl(34) synthesis GTPase MnmE [Gammaproteobacteria bacterium]NIR92035.1 tRNA uridine-5-carboxymethylaminomethyl(34) synthesis GTPase MnmE [Gammaproteobacteria bacterium]NIT63724.1 tRNA uridine-5-carboxymethylaminomethyl(34) synthesis GTPase MnmE [Gammaproteobacteria bacterium]NIV51903.1 tRNA uridine-5-carboxymethylaminomethyl(34) synthesis GTPase MnmE [Gammaproteobacteria bacterium]NIW86496.1 tRNA uridine-5-carboxymethylaminomethyl(34) synthesis GTPase Mnm